MSLNQLKVSVVTATLNSERTVKNSIESVNAQTWPSIEHIIIDGGSIDSTVSFVRSSGNRISHIVSEADNGIYDALNKGFLIATGDIIGILHSDDIYADTSVLEQVAETFNRTAADYVYGDIEMVNSKGLVVRYWRTGELKNGLISSSQLPHPALFLSSGLAKRLKPPFDPSYKISADVKQQLIVANILRAKGIYLPRPLVKMRVGGRSTRSPYAYLQGWFETRRAWNEVHGSGGLSYVLKKAFSKIKGVRGVW